MNDHHDIDNEHGMDELEEILKQFSQTQVSERDEMELERVCERLDKLHQFFVKQEQNGKPLEEDVLQDAMSRIADVGQDDRLAAVILAERALAADDYERVISICEVGRNRIRMSIFRL